MEKLHPCRKQWFKVSRIASAGASVASQNQDFVSEWPAAGAAGHGAAPCRIGPRGRLRPAQADAPRA